MNYDSIILNAFSTTRERQILDNLSTSIRSSTDKPTISLNNFVFSSRDRIYKSILIDTIDTYSRNYKIMDGINSSFRDIPNIPFSTVNNLIVSLRDDVKSNSVVMNTFKTSNRDINENSICLNGFITSREDAVLDNISVYDNYMLNNSYISGLNVSYRNNPNKSFTTLNSQTISILDTVTPTYIMDGFFTTSRDSNYNGTINNYILDCMRIGVSIDSIVISDKLKASHEAVVLYQSMIEIPQTLIIASWY